MKILRQKEYARRDYEGLTADQEELLRRNRNKLAKQLNEDRKLIHEMYDKSEKITKEKGLEKSKEEAALNLFKQGRKKRLDSKIGEAETFAKNWKNSIKHQMSEEDIKAALGKTDSKPNPTKNKEEVDEGFVKRGLNKWKNLSKGKKIATIAIPTAAVVGTSIAVHKSKKKKKEPKEKTYTRKDIKTVAINEARKIEPNVSGYREANEVLMRGVKPDFDHYELNRNINRGWSAKKRLDWKKLDSKADEFIGNNFKKPKNPIILKRIFK